MKDLEKLETLLDVFKECLNDGDLEELTKKNKEENQNNIKKAKEIIKEEYLTEDTTAIILVNDTRTLTVGPQVSLLTLLSCLIDNMAKNIDLDDLIHAIIGGLAIEEDCASLDKDKVKEVIQCLKKYL